MVVHSTVQVLMAVALAIILGVIAFSVYNLETVRAIQESGKIRRRVDIFKGIKDLKTTTNEAYNTLDPAHPTYKDLGGSVNQVSGAEYSYNFWMFLATNALSQRGGADAGRFTTDSGLTNFTNAKVTTTALDDKDKPLVLFMRGNKKPYVYRSLCDTPEDERYKVDVLVKNPLMKLEMGGDVLSVEINTVASPESVREKARDTCGEIESTSWANVNSHKVAVQGLRTNEDLVDKWFMVTLVVQDTFPTDPLPIRNKIRVRLYVNGVLELDKYLDGRLAEVSDTATVMKNNAGNLYIMPEIKLNNTPLTRQPTENNMLKLADMSYFNYALDMAEIGDLLSSGFTAAAAPGLAQVATVDTGSQVSVPGSSPALSSVLRDP
jgi:uncharacterized lipoprotein NlpE involved in copper resistance